MHVRIPSIIKLPQQRRNIGYDYIITLGAHAQLGYIQFFYFNFFKFFI